MFITSNTSKLNLKENLFLTIEFRQLEFKDIYTRAVLLKYTATMMSEADAYIIESYLEANSRSVAMRELANSVIRNRMQNLFRQTTTKPAEQLLPLNPSNRQHQLFHKLAVEEKALPKGLRAQPVQQQRKQNNSFKVKKHYRQQGRQQNQKFTPNNGGGNRKQPSTPKKQFAGAPRPRAKQPAQAGRGQQNVNTTQNGNSKSSNQKMTTPEAAVAQLRGAYDITKISEQLEHFGNTTPEVQLMLQHQLVQRSLDIAPNPKKPSKTPTLD